MPVKFELLQIVLFYFFSFFVVAMFAVGGLFQIVNSNKLRGRMKILAVIFFGAAFVTCLEASNQLVVFVHQCRFGF